MIEKRFFFQKINWSVCLILCGLLFGCSSSSSSEIPGEAQNTPTSTMTPSPVPSSTPTHTQTPIPTATPEAGGGKIFFIDKADDGKSYYAVFQMDPAGENIIQIAPNEFHSANLRNFEVSPNGEKVAFSFCCLKDQVIKSTYVYVAHTDGSGMTQLTQSGKLVHDYNPRWSPDGSQIIFTRRVGHNEYSHLFTINTDGTEIKKLSDVNFPSGYFIRNNPNWSPQGGKILFWAEEEKPLELFIDGEYRWYPGTNSLNVINPDGSNLIKLSDNVGFSTDWSPDGSRIIFTEKDTASEDFYNLYVIQPDGNKLMQLAEEVSRISWSPDQSLISYIKPSSLTASHTKDLIVILPDGSELIQITGLSIDERSVTYAWAPDSSKLAVSLDKSDVKSLYIIGIDGTKEVLVHEIPGTTWLSGLAWSPDSNHLIYILQKKTYITTNWGTRWLPDDTQIYSFNLITGETVLLYESTYKDVNPYLHWFSPKE